ncbi:heme-binding protein soul2 [Pimephales promelas]|uniref:heme-binding protein soul2 n=1 Tax=Pimephales promelas TaxID=90988 RepID=UPI001955A854|nr:heme-binding protein soul2 [Pimephales promelas]KAG1951093.1 heme-binding protein [Pimephales promelas]
MARNLPSALCLLFGLICLPYTECWEAPWFCHGYKCPMYTLVKEYQGFEERSYNMSYWIATDITSTGQSDIKDGFWKLYNFNQGQNSKSKVIDMTRPVLVSVKEADGMGERQVSISVFQSDSDIPEPTDTTIRKTVAPAGTVYVRSFGGMASDQDALENVQQLKDDLRAAGKDFIENRFDAAGYDAPWDLINRHNEVWVRAP